MQIRNSSSEGISSAKGSEEDEQELSILWFNTQ
jgi:hypothetical protein